MRILMLRQKGLVLPSIHLSMSRAFASLGAEVSELPFPETPAAWEDLKAFGPGKNCAVFTLDLPLDPDLRKPLREYQASIGIPWLIWFVDDPEGYDFPSSCDPARTLVFCWDREICGRLSLDPAWKGPPLIHLPLASDPELFFPEPGNPAPLFPGGVFSGSLAPENAFLRGAAESCADFSRDLSRIWEAWQGNWTISPRDLAFGYLREKTGEGEGEIGRHPLARLWVHAAAHVLGARRRQEVVSRAIARGGAVFGDGKWAGVLGEAYRGRIDYGEALRRAYNRSSFVLDVRPAQARSGLTQRVYDAAACARPVLADFSPETESLFDPREEIFSYRTLEEAGELSRVIRSDPREAKKKAGRARARFLALHTYRNRAAKVLASIQRDFPACLA